MSEQETSNEKIATGFNFSSLVNKIPVLPTSIAVLLLILNIFFPSTGTFYMACIGDKFRKSQIFVGVLQLMTSFLLVGWIWSIYWGIVVVKKSY
jgi:uncharacterized membrane protein (DUF485 family)